MSVEKIVRPFQTGDVFNARVLPPEQPPLETGVEVVALEWAGSAESKWIEEPPPATMGFTIEWIEDKRRRVTEKVRVENPDDPSQFVELERIKSTVFKNNKSGEEMPFKMDWSL